MTPFGNGHIIKGSKQKVTKIVSFEKMAEKHLGASLYLKYFKESKFTEKLLI